MQILRITGITKEPSELKLHQSLKYKGLLRKFNYLCHVKKKSRCLFDLLRSAQTPYNVRICFIAVSSWKESLTTSFCLMQ